MEFVFLWSFLRIAPRPLQDVIVPWPEVRRELFGEGSAGNHAGATCHLSHAQAGK